MSAINKKRIFIGGTGRSGTTILSKLIGSHNEIQKIPFESRFLIDHSGLINLFNSLTNDYSIDQGRVSIREFENLMCKDLSNPYKTPYLGHPIHRYKQPIKEHTEELIKKISLDTFEGLDFHSKDNSQYMPLIRYILKPLNSFLIKTLKVRLKIYGYTGVVPKEKMYIAQYFNNENELLQIIGDYIDQIFKVFLKNNDTSWCEDTPANIYHINFLNKIFPSAYFIHIIRHPVAVAYSMMKMNWAPDSVKKVCDLLSQLYEKDIVSYNYGVKNETNYLFIKLEELTDPVNQKKVIDFIGLKDPHFSNEISIEENRINYYLDEIDKKDLDYIQNRLSKYISFFDYKILSI